MDKCHRSTLNKGHLAKHHTAEGHTRTVCGLLGVKGTVLLTALCTIPGCANPATRKAPSGRCGGQYTGRVCEMHYKRLWYHGTPNFIGRPIEQPLRQAVVGYHAQHDRLRRDLGPASAYPCVDCALPGQQWSYIHGDPNELHSRYGTYSLLHAYYAPRCVSCHATFDKADARVHAA